MNHIEYTVVGRIARIVLNRPRYRNAQSAELLQELDLAFNRAADDASVRVIILAAHGESFSSGHDLGTAEERANPNSIFKAKGLDDIYLRSRELFLDNALRWRDLPKPTIAAVQGHCILGGYILAGAMDMIVAADNARFLPGLTQYFSLPWDINIRKAKEILFQSRFVTATEAADLEMVNKVVPLAELEAETLALARRIAEVNPLQLRLMKLAINQAQDAMGFRATIRDAHSHHMLTRVEAYLSEGFGHGRDLLVERNPAVSRALAEEKPLHLKEER